MTAPEPSQETGLGASHLNPYRAAVKSSSPSPDQEQEQELASSSHRPSRDSASSGPASAGSSSPAQLPHHRYPTPPSSASPTDRGGGVGCDLDPSNPFSTSFSHRSHSHSRSTSSSSAAFAASLPPFHDTEPSHFYHYSTRSSASSIERPYDHTTTSHQRRHRPTTWGGYSSYSSYGSSNTSNSFCHADQHQHQHQHQQRQRLSGSNSPDYTSTAAEKKAASTEILEVAPVSKNHPLEHRRSSSLGQRFPGDMSHRPLDMIKREVQAAERPHRRRRRINDTDSIDQLDTIGGSYHHGGPYDATLTSRNLNKKYSPVAAVAESNMEAIRATPRENVIDSLRKHVPLQGTSSIPPGVRGPNGRVMRYTEGADLMREPDAEGGAYKRYEDVVSRTPPFPLRPGCLSWTVVLTMLLSNIIPTTSRARASRHSLLSATSRRTRAIATIPARPTPLRCGPSAAATKT